MQNLTNLTNYGKLAYTNGEELKQEVQWIAASIKNIKKNAEVEVHNFNQQNANTNANLVNATFNNVNNPVAVINTNITFAANDANQNCHLQISLNGQQVAQIVKPQNTNCICGIFYFKVKNNDTLTVQVISQTTLQMENCHCQLVGSFKVN